MFQLSSSEKVDVLSIDAGESEDSPPSSPVYEELVELKTRAVAQLNINWPAGPNFCAQKQGARPKSKLDERFFASKITTSSLGPPIFSRFA